MTLNEGILLLLAVYMLGVGVYGMRAPGTSGNRGPRVLLSLSDDLDENSQEQQDPEEHPDRA
jgi:hypothetical protein